MMRRLRRALDVRKQVVGTRAQRRTDCPKDLAQKASEVPDTPEKSTGFVAHFDQLCRRASGLRIRRIHRVWRAEIDLRGLPNACQLMRARVKIPSTFTDALESAMNKSTEVDTRGPSSAPTRAEINALTTELRALNAEMRDLVGALLGQEENDSSQRIRPTRSESLPQLMTIEEAAEQLKVSTKAFYARIKRGAVPGVLRVGKRRLMVKTDEFLRGLRRVSTVEGRDQSDPLTERSGRESR